MSATETGMLAENLEANSILTNNYKILLKTSVLVGVKSILSPQRAKLLILKMLNIAIAQIEVMV
ncbi:MAG: hypothetical protein WCP03_01730 [Candidatus Saccharibacteria bacterium]